MAEHRVKRIATKSQPRSHDQWDEAWLPPVVEHIGKVARYGRDRVLASSARLAYWCGVAGVAGGSLWILLFLSLQLEELSIEYGWYSLEAWMSAKLLVVPLLLFLFCLAALFILQEKQRLRGVILRRTGFILATLGFISVMLSTLDKRWLAHWLGVPSDGLLNYLQVDYLYSGPLFDWRSATFPPVLLLCVGLALFGLATIQAKALPTWVITWLVITSLAIFVVPIGFSILFANDYDLLYPGGVFAGTMLLFGVGWVIIGAAFLRGRARPPIASTTLRDTQRA